MSLQVQSVQMKQKTNLVYVVADSCNEEVTNSLQPELELPIIEPSEITLQKHILLDPCECTPPQPKLQKETSVEKWVRLKVAEDVTLLTVGLND
jgi:hypothetical protein